MLEKRYYSQGQGNEYSSSSDSNDEEHSSIGEEQGIDRKFINSN